MADVRHSSRATSTADGAGDVRCCVECGEALPRRSVRLARVQRCRLCATRQAIHDHWQWQLPSRLKIARAGVAA
jgi:RNA polymerase-binding transcription factor DksA